MFLVGKHEGKRDHLKDSDVDGKKILEWILGMSNPKP